MKTHATVPNNISRRLGVLAALCVAGFLCGGLDKRIAPSLGQVGLASGSSATAALRVAPAATSPQSSAALRSEDTAESLLALPERELYARLALWLLDADEAGIFDFRQRYIQQGGKEYETLRLIDINWARLNPRGAIDAATGDEERCDRWFAWACHDPEAALTADAEAGRKMSGDVCSAIGEFHPAWLVAHFDRIPEEARETAVRSLSNLSSNDPITARTMQLAAKWQDPNLLNALLPRFIRSDPFQAWLWQHAQTLGSNSPEISLPASRRLKVAWGKFAPMKRTHLLPTLVFGLSVLGTQAQEKLPDMALIPAGTFEMGDHHGFVDPKHGGDETPLHKVRLDAFAIGINDVTTREYCEFLNAALTQQHIAVRDGGVYLAKGGGLLYETRAMSPHSRIAWDGKTFAVLDKKENHPVICIRWSGAAAYCNWLSAQRKLPLCYTPGSWECDFNKSGFRLPTEAEWEYAACGGQQQPYWNFPWSNTADPTKANWPESNNPYRAGLEPWTTPVGFFDGKLHRKAGFVLHSPEVTDGGALPKDYTGDGSSATLPLKWSGAPDGTKSYALIMHHQAPDQIKWYWILYHIPADVKSLPKNVQDIGTLGGNSVNNRAGYAPPHSKGPGAKNYIYTLYALSSDPQPKVPAAQVSRDFLLESIKDKILASAELRVVYSRPEGATDQAEPRGAGRGTNETEKAARPSEDRPVPGDERAAPPNDNPEPRPAGGNAKGQSGPRGGGGGGGGDGGGGGGGRTAMAENKLPVSPNAG
jgi:formylglycine-generating enzyme required for sulfatase activity/phosphatidylethanolamine-binding protein (PEBP) family uncharacterized protein